MALRRGILSLLAHHRVGITSGGIKNVGITNACINNVSITNVGIRQYASEGMYGDLDLLTGMQKKELLAHIAGECDPFHIMPIKRGATAPGTRCKPILVPSTNESRMLGCLCCDDQTHIEYVVLHQCRPTRCACGYWFVLTPVAPV